MPLLLLKLLGIGKWLREAATALLGIIGRYPREAAIVVLCGLSLWLWHGKANEHRKYLAERGARAADRAAYEQASLANLAAQIAQNKVWEAKSTTIARSADNAYNEGLADGRSRAAAYAASHGVRWKAGACVSATSEAGESPAPPSDNTAGQDAVYVSKPDYDTLIENSLRLKAAHDWGQGLIDAGLGEALPEVGFGN